MDFDVQRVVRSQLDLLMDEIEENPTREQFDLLVDMVKDWANSFELEMLENECNTDCNQVSQQSEYRDV